MPNEQIAPETQNASAAPDLNGLQEIIQKGFESVNQRFEGIESRFPENPANEPLAPKPAQADPIETAYPELAGFIGKKTEAMKQEFQQTMQKHEQDRQVKNAIEHLESRSDYTDELHKKVIAIINRGDYAGLTNPKKVLELAYRDAGGLAWAPSKASSSKENLESTVKGGGTKVSGKINAKSLASMSSSEVKKLEESGKLKELMESGTFWEE